MIRRINLLPEELRVVNKRYFYVASLFILAIYTFAIYVSYLDRKSTLSSLESKKGILAGEVSRLTIENSAHRDIAEKIKAVESAKKELETRSAIFRTLSEGAVPWSDLLYNLSNTVPSGLWLTNLTSSGTFQDKGQKRFKLNGMALSNGLITDFLTAINNSPYLSEGTLTYANKSEYSGRSVFVFEINCKMKERK